MSDNKLDNRNENELSEALEKAKYTIFKSYIHDLKNMAVVYPDDDILEMKTEDCIRLLHLKKLTKQKGEDVMQKLTTVYNSVLSTGASLIVMVDAPEKDSPINIYLGVRHYTFKNEGNQTASAVNTLRAGMESQFPGTILNPVTTNHDIDGNIDSLLDDIFDQNANVSIASVSTVASIRDKSRTENKGFIQGIERLIDAMSGKSYTALFIADPISSEERSNIRRGMETLYTTIAPFAKSVWSYNENSSEAVMRSLSSTVGEAVTDGTAWTQSHTLSHTRGSSDSVNVGLSMGMDHRKDESETIMQGKNSGVTIRPGKILGTIGGVAASVASMINPIAGTVVGVVAGIVGNLAEGVDVTKGKSSSVAKTIGESIGKSLGINAGYEHTWSRSETEGDIEGRSTQHNDTKMNNKTKSKSKTTTKGMGRTLQIENQNKMVVEILKQIEEQIKRTKESEDYGLFSCGAYFISRDKVTSTLAANTYRALMIGEGSSVESSAVNIWSGHNDERVKTIQQYLRHFYQPVFVCPWDNNGNFMPFSASTMVSGLELPLHLGLPMSSVLGLTVMEHASFGRNVGDKENGILLGNLYHMGRDDGQRVLLDKDSLTGHVFVTGSTGSGKSNTIYQMLSELKKDGIKFLVIEPAKGEYKNVFGNNDNLSSDTSVGESDSQSISCARDCKVTVYGTNPEWTELLRINPFKFTKKIHVYEHLDRLVEIFNACWPMYAAMPAVLKDAIERAYVDAGWNMKTSENKYNLYPTFADVLDKIDEVMEESKYSTDSKGDYIGALSTRLRSMTTGINSMIFTNDDLSDEELFENNVIVDLSRLGSMETKSLIMGLLVMKQQEYRISQGGTPNKHLNHVTVLEEAHNLLKRTSTEQSSETSNLIGKSVEMLANSIAEMRTYGEGFIIADQSPGLLDMSVIRNTNTKIIMRLPDFSDRELVGKAAGLNDEQILELAKLKRGVAAVYQNDWIEAVLCAVKEYKYDEKVSWVPYNSCHVNDTTDLTKEIISIIMNHKLIENSIDDFKDKVIKTNSIRSGVKRIILEYFDTEIKDTNSKLSELSDNFFNSAQIMGLLKLYPDIEKWEKAAMDIIAPSIDDYDIEEIRNVLQLILIEELKKNVQYEDVYQAYREHLHVIRGVR